jgi:uncharacterized SAM-binding protein YcdF (DUF218 family)
MAMLWIKALVKWLVLPPAGPLLLALAGLALLRRRPRPAYALIAIGVLSLALLSIPAIGGLLVRSLDRSPPLDVARVSGAQAIVILGGGTRRYAPEYGGATLGAITLERVRYGARIARATSLPVLVSGGAVRGAPPEALLMRNVLADEFGVPERWTETRSRNTHENAVQSARLLQSAGVQRVILVGHSFDFPRTRAEFAAAGIDTIAAPIGIPPAVPTAVGDYLPSVAGLRLSYYALYEILANVLFHLSH